MSIRPICNTSFKGNIRVYAASSLNDDFNDVKINTNAIKEINLLPGFPEKTQVVITNKNLRTRIYTVYKNFDRFINAYNAAKDNADLNIDLRS